MVTMSQEELKRFEILSKANAGFVTVKEASDALGISERQVKRLKKKVRENGATGLVHGNSGKTPSNKISDETRNTILSLRKEPGYVSSNFAHFNEYLLEEKEIDISYNTLYQMLTEEGIKSPRTRRRYKPHRRRKRKPQAGLLLQVDATPYAWFKGDRARYAIHGAIDDATGQVVALYMCKNECLHGYFEMFRIVIDGFGIPASIYADRHTIFQSPNSKKAEVDASIKVNDTQLGRALKELGINLIAARSPQAKGRIERLWNTLQDRLKVEFEISNITDIDTANKFLAKYIYKYNSYFAVEPECADSLFRKPPETTNINHMLCIKEYRIVDAGGIFSYYGKSFMIQDPLTGIIPSPHAKITVLSSPHFGIKAEFRDRILDVLPYVPPKRSTKKPENTQPKESPSQKIPPANHPWRSPFLPKKQDTIKENNSDINQILEKIFAGRK